jgi:hypothetical protein
MATFFVDYEGGNDGNAGTSFALRWKTLTNGATAARIAPGDTIRVMASPDPTSLGVTGAWTDGPLASTQAITSSTNATPIVITKVAHGYLNGDTLIVSGHTTNTNANGTWTVANKANDTLELQGSVGNGVGGASGTMRKMNNAVVTLSAAVNKNIALPVDGGTGGRGSKANWTQSANVTCTVTTADFKQGGECQSIALAAGFTTGLAAFFALGASTDYSAYQQGTFWIKQTAGTIGAAGDTQIQLCSDVAGATPVDSFDVPALGSLNVWFPVTFNKGSALGAAIQSVNFNVVTDNGAQTFLIDNIVAVKSTASDDSLNLHSLIGKNTAGESWFCIQSILGTRVMLDQSNATIPASSPQRGYSGTTETLTTYKREPIDVTPNAVTVFGTVNDSGTTAAHLVYSFGWDRVAMTTQSGSSFFSGQTGNATGFDRLGSGYVYVDFNGTFGAFRFGNGLNIPTGSISLNIDTMYHGNNNGAAGITTSDGGSGELVSFNAFSNNNGTFGIFCGLRHFGIVSATANGNLSHGIDYRTGGIDIGTLTAKNNGGFAINGQIFDAPGYIRNLTTSGNASGSISAQSASDLYIKNALISEATEASVAIGGRVISNLHDGIAGNTQIFTGIGRVASEATVRKTTSGLSWSFSPTSTTAEEKFPLSMEIAMIAITGNALVTVSVWLRRTDTGLTLRLMCKGNQIAGVAADVSSAMTAVADTWEQRTITFTPTETGVVSITVEAYGGTTFIGYADDFSASQG